LPIEKFVIEGANKFRLEHGEPYFMGLYSCPSIGWISLNFNTNENFSVLNCPDFEYVEYDLIEFEEWISEYESGSSEWMDLSGDTIILGMGDSDEVLNITFFHFLKLIIEGLKQANQLPKVLVQLLDSRFKEEIK